MLRLPYSLFRLPNLLEACAATKFRGKARLVSASASSSANKPASLQGFTVARPAQPAGVTGIAAKARPIPSSDPFGAERFERSRAKTPQGYTRAFNSVSRELIGLPLTRKQQDEIRAQRPKLKPGSSSPKRSIRTFTAPRKSVNAHRGSLKGASLDGFVAKSLFQGQSRKDWLFSLGAWLTETKRSA